MNTEERTKAILSLSQSYLLPLRVLFKTLKGIISRAAYGTLLPDEAGRLTNSAHAAIGYTGAVLDRERPKAADIWKPDFLDVDDLASSKGLADGASLELSCDVVIVGSGAGGGVVAAELATAGYSVLVLDKGTFTHAPDLPLTELESADLLYEQRGLLQSDSGSIFIFAGSVFGGGTYINWSGSLRLPQTVREEWAQKWNLPLFTSAAYNESLDKIEARLGISDARIVHNQPNSILLEGAKKLGYPASAIPQNTGTHEHSCGHCGMGCPFGEKQGTSVTYLHDAARHGAAFVEGCFVERITHENGVATGVTARAGSNKRPLTIRAKRVVCSAGSLSTPPLLQRSGLRNPHIGKHLKVHPVGLVFGVFPDRLIQPFKGSIMTVVCNAVADISGTGYGPLLEIPYMHPSLYSMILPFRSRQDHKRLMTMFDRVVPIIVLLREEDTEGDVWQDEANLLRVNYEIKSRDLDRIAKGMEVATEILVAAGADEIFTPQQDLKAFNVGGGGEAVLETEAYKEFVEEMKRQKWHVPLFCAHQMGSARMSGDKGKGVCNAEGETWEVKGLWVADTSLFPTASGVK
ncbi:hypothetical protein HK097_010417 [Rhizophlyctis rosea]|uniref:Long-chain-alcohol oxidase n=1 Tax=Rhizophlyctis rosea TaxID=64517 RepID=A0AAD5SHF3_9FUNG|nr:hypothetical protein HK097_010417 [Rhizophlyctis rosea]